MSRPLIGAHVPARGRPTNAVDEAEARGAEAFQIFVSNPRAWAPPTMSAEAAEEFRARREAAGSPPAFAHSSYLVNIAAPNPEFWRRSVELALGEARVAAALALDGLVVHAGAGGPGERAAAVARASAAATAIAEVGAPLLLELTAGGSGTVASTLHQAVDLLDAAGGDPRLGIVIDTCHLFAAGAPLDDPRQAPVALDPLDVPPLSRRLRLVHANDARDPRGSRRDRHAHVGEGHIGEEGFRAILAHEAVRRVPVIIETPGKVEEDLRNIALLRRLAGD
ncbi:MAG TPA: deoxyribonuclease IV [Actinomycetota bacterium]